MFSSDFLLGRGSRCATVDCIFDRRRGKSASIVVAVSPLRALILMLDQIVTLTKKGATVTYAGETTIKYLVTHMTRLSRTCNINSTPSPARQFTRSDSGCACTCN